jgi:hypothetical protein
VIHQSDDEVVIIPAHVGPETVRTTPWEQIGPGLVFVAVPTARRSRTVCTWTSPRTRVTTATPRSAALLERGARRADVGQPADGGSTVVADPDGNEFGVLSARDI